MKKTSLIDWVMAGFFIGVYLSLVIILIEYPENVGHIFARIVNGFNEVKK